MYYKTIHGPYNVKLRKFISYFSVNIATSSFIPCYIFNPLKTKRRLLYFKDPGRIAQ